MVRHWYNMGMTTKMKFSCFLVIPLVDWCCLCRNGGELVDHLLIHCDLAYWGAMSLVYLEIIGWCHVDFLIYQLVGEIGLVNFPLCLMLLLWWECNSCTSDYGKVLEVQLRLSFLRLLYEWSTVMGLSDSGTINKFANWIFFTSNSLITIL